MSHRNRLGRTLAVVLGATCATILRTMFEPGQDLSARRALNSEMSRSALVHAQECTPVWQASESLECPTSGIDGKKTPISFAVPLPTAPDLEDLIATCGGSVRMDVSFQRWNCSQSGLPLPKLDTHVEVRLPGNVDGGGDLAVPTGTCMAAIPPSLIGFLITSDGTALVPSGIATTRISCCDGCGP